ncbi:AAA family ATPase [Bifidobacterium sp. LC6]|uniref:Uncharacterized AAA domain-containing protein ycf46 n=1 Tax=Bifidobacterium colobi TaxID=2809026 RepID=A0ABS5USQ5_9BIFI|nr:AAA family ATPase [Bifidobacterium colobi]MBT1174054.1 AAA family ATPase [Bifidobacterium colobi]
MSDYAAMKTDLTDYIRAGVPLVVVRTTERHRVERALRQIVQELGISAFCYTDAKQVEALGGIDSGGNTASASGKDVDSDPLAFVKDTFRRSRHVPFMLGDTRKLDQDSLYTRELLSAAYLAKDSGNTLVIVAAEQVWQRLARFGLFINLELPTFDERLAMIGKFAEQYGDRVSFSATGMEQLSTLLRGLSEIQVTNLLRSSLVARGMLTDADVSAIAESKSRLYTPVANVTAVKYPAKLEVAGLEGLKSWLDRKRNVFFAPNELLDRYALQSPRGILLMGVPGCGKSFSAKMIAARWGLPLFRFDIGSVYNKYVGETERRMQEALTYIDNVAPCVLWIDEIEKALSTDSGESDVGNRVLGQFLFWLQESQAKVFLVATANNVDHLPPELFRKGRFSESFFIDLPNHAEREAAIALYAGLSLHQRFDAAELSRLADASEGFSYSDIEQSVKDLAEQRVFGGLEQVTVETMERHFNETIPISASRIAHIREWGARNARSASADETATNTTVATVTNQQAGDDDGE